MDNSGVLLLNPHPRVYLSDALEEVIQILPFSADIKAVKTKTYISGNTHTAKLLGVTPHGNRTEKGGIDFR